jgi:N-terminal domain of galactosyltransferase/N-terminal region of glycosyl transferase group 7
MHIFKGATFASLAVALYNMLSVSMKQELACFAFTENIDINKAYLAKAYTPCNEGHTTSMMESKNPHHAIVIPYRERLHNARDFVSFMEPYLARNVPNATFSVYFVEQVDSGLFSRGFLLNAGLNEIKRRRPEIQCVILHDIDLLPLVDGVPYDDCTYPIQLSSELEHFDWGVPYDGSCGGVISLHMNDWIKVNGMSNSYEGWGGEDDDLYIRLRLNGLLYGTENRMPLRPPMGKGRFSNCENASTISNENRNKGEHANYGSNVAIVREMEIGSHRWRVDGLKDIAYFLVNHIEVVPKGALGGNGIDKVHIVKVTGRTSCHGPKINVTLPCIKGEYL